MRKATVLCSVLILALAAPACGRKPGESPRCRIFEDPVPAHSDRATLDQLQEAYEDMARLGECAKAAGQSVEEYMERHEVARKVEEAAREAAQAVQGAAETVVDRARRAAEQVQEGAQRAIDESAERIEQGIEAATGR